MKFKMKRVLSILVAFAMLVSMNLDCMSIAAAENSESADKDFVLTMETKTGEGYNAHLTWNDISDKENRYGYKILRRKEAGEWETRSTWDGEEKVRVLNIYPCEAAKNYLKNWMSQPLDKNPAEMAGKGLFDIDTVAISTYNTDPDSYLKDKDGNYQYDVLMFGTYDGNDWKDLSEKSYQATQRFVDSGRGVLFGHDTVTSNTTVDNPQFAKFADQMGIKLSRDGSAIATNKVKVVNQGFLTSYPWKLSGTLIIPPAHALGQFVGGTTTATVWMKFDGQCRTDAETGASNDGYLYSKNSLAMIQTGHSSGQATDDERMVLANTLFYLKQNTSTTSSVDQSFYDETAPEAPEVNVESLDTIHLSSKDLGTEYEYKVEAIPGIPDQPSYQTNSCKATAESGLKGFITGVSENEEPMKELLVYGEDGSLKSEVTKAEDGKTAFDISKYEPGVKYLHVYAVDNAGNVSKETVTKVRIPNVVSIDSMKTVADTYVLEADENQDLTFTTDIDYTVKASCEGKVKYSFLEDGKEMKAWEKNVVLEKNKNSLSIDSELEIATKPDPSYELKVDLYTLEEEDKEVLAKSETVSFTLTKLKEFKLTADVTSGKDYSVDLTWSDLNDGKNRYGYRVFRSKEREPWETRSTWNGQEKVKVLNIYPCENAKNYLKNWMDSPLSNSNEKAGMGLFDIDTISIGSYNSNPDAYLKDADGNYKYDVLMFGTYDRNADKDLTEKSFQATQAFIDSGRGVLFGHDTVTSNTEVDHPIFARFSEQLGAKLTYNGTYKKTNKVDVINQAFITSYPWKLSGTLTIPTTHALGQYTGGTTTATVWMKLQVNNITDAETGATDNAYLFSKNALAMIQTGHSSGQATDDERKVFANTLFYLKQSSSETSARDQSFYDETAPEVPVVDAADFEAVTLTSVDKGTNYQYYVEGIPANTKKKNRQTNIVDAQALSGLRGFIIGISESEKTMKDLLVYNKDGSLKSEVIPAENGKAVYDVSEAEPGVKYLHVYAVDNAGNVSEEQVTEVVIPDRVVIDSVKTIPDSYMLKPYEEQTVHVTTTIDYAVRPDCQGILKYKILEDGKEISSWNKEVTLYRDKNSVAVESETEISVYPDFEYTLTADFYTLNEEKEEVLQKSEIIPLTVDVSKLKDFVLAADGTTGKEYTVDLSWTDLTDEESTYGYNVYRSKEGSDWENCATSEKEAVDGTILTRDPLFYDEAVPDMPVVDAAKLDEIKLFSTDKGTTYTYYVESVPANKKKISRKTNIADAVAQSEIKGFIVGVSESMEPMSELLKYNEDGQLISDVILAEEGVATFDVSKYKSGTEYIHVYAVDNAGNVSDETVVEVTVPKEYFESPYALFASDDVVQMYCCEANIQGDVYGKEKFFCQGSQLHLNGTASTTNKFTFANGATDIKDSKEGIEPVILPDYMEHILVNMRADSECVDNIGVYNNTDINAPTLCKSTTGAWCDYVNINASLVSQESISLNAQGVSGGKDKPIVLASQNGDIRIQTIDFDGSGLIYAPNGTVVINVNNFNYTGTIIAKKIEIQASYYNHSLLTSYK